MVLLNNEITDYEYDGVTPTEILDQNPKQIFTGILGVVDTLD